MSFQNPITGGGGELILDNIHSRGYSAGSSGWSIKRDGTAEFNDATIRGTLDSANIVGGDILIGPDNKPQVHIHSGTNYGTIEFPSNLADELGANGVFGQTQFDGTASEQIILHATSGTHQNSFYFGRASLDLFSDSADGSIGPMAQFRIDGQDVADFWSDKIELKKAVYVTAKLDNANGGVVNVSFSSATSHTETVTFSTPFTSPPRVYTNIASGSGAAAHWDSRAINITTSGFTLFVFAPLSGSAATWSNIPVNWDALGD